MHYIELHIGDYDKDTAHLTACEDGIYGRLLRRYYNTEAALPVNVKAVQRLVRARTREERDAVETMLSEFFTLSDDGWHNGRADREIVRYADKKAKAKRSANARWNNAPDDANAMRTHCDGNAHQAPSTNLSTESPTEGTRTARPPENDYPRFEGHDDPRPAAPNPVAPFAMALNKLGVRCTAMNPDLVAYHAAGGTVEHLLEVAGQPACAGKPAAYVARFAFRELTQPANYTLPGVRHEKPGALTAVIDHIRRRHGDGPLDLSGFSDDEPDAETLSG